MKKTKISLNQLKELSVSVLAKHQQSKVKGGIERSKIKKGDVV